MCYVVCRPIVARDGLSCPGDMLGPSKLPVPPRIYETYCPSPDCGVLPPLVKDHWTGHVIQLTAAAILARMRGGFFFLKGVKLELVPR